MRFIHTSVCLIGVKETQSAVGLAFMGTKKLQHSTCKVDIPYVRAFPPLAQALSQIILGFAQPSNFVILWPLHAFCACIQGAKAGYNYLQTCPKSFRSPEITIESGQGPCPASLEL